jgi:rsbT antagonist protein RsbS
MSRNIPIIKFHGNLLVSIQMELSDRLVNELKEDVCDEIQKVNPTGLIIEVSGVDIFDSYIARSIRDISQIASLMGVKSVIAGLDPSMAITLVEMGLVLSGVPTALNLESAMEMVEEREQTDEELYKLFDDDFSDEQEYLEI